MTDDQELLQLILDLVERPEASGDRESPAGLQLTGDMELTSLELVRLLVGLEEHLDIQIDDAEVMNANFQTVDDIVSLVRKSLAISGRAG